MVDFVHKRFQVFVSSTFTDLVQERQAAVEAILTAGHIPAGMELFTSGDESQMEVIKQWIDESDVYLLILGGRYGSVEPRTGKSYTQLEYEYALEMKKPLFSCVITEDALEARVKAHGTSAVEMNDPAALREFRSQVLSRMVKFWSDSKDIKIAVGETLAHFSRREDLVGWVRPAKSVDLEGLLNEISRLSQENAHLRSQASSSSSEPPIAGFTFQELLELLQGKKLLTFFEKNRAELAGDGLYGGASSKCEELKFLGLAQQAPHRANHFVITPEGRRFLSRLDLLRMRETPKGTT